ncbi:MAG: hypothetical protein WCA27_23020 [Candidatus Sulfotelmatobacter sp.]
MKIEAGEWLLKRGDTSARRLAMVIAFPMRTETGEFVERTLSHEGNALPKFYAALEGPVPVGIEATGAMQWFLELLEELGIAWDFW